MNKYAYMKMMFPYEMRKRAAEDEAAQKDSKKEQKAKDKEKAKAENQASKSERRRSGKYHSELLGGTTSALTSGALGALLGGAIGKGMKFESPVMGPPGVGMPEDQQNQSGPMVGEDGKPMFESKDHMWTGAAVGGVTGLLYALLANSIGRGLAGFAGPRTLKKQKDYNASVGQTLGNYFVPGMQGWNKARTRLTKDEQDAVMQEYLLKDKLKDAGLA